MAVVINELEVTPQAGNPAGGAPQPAGHDAGTLTPSQWHELQRRMGKEQERRSRLTAY